jgi:hypothetical protein
VLEVVEKTPRQLILRDQRPTAGLIAIVFTFINLAALVMMLFQLVVMFPDRITESDGALWLLGMGVFISLSIFFMGMGIMATIQFWVGTACILDKDAETLTLQQIDFFRTQTEQHSIYGISHVEIDTNEEVHAYGVFIVLRSGKRLPVASYHQHDKDVMQTTVNYLRQFLRDG